MAETEARQDEYFEAAHEAGSEALALTRRVADDRGLDSSMLLSLVGAHLVTLSHLIERERRQGIE